MYTFLFGALTGAYAWHRAIKSYMHSLGRTMPFRGEHVPQLNVPTSR